MDRSEGVNVVPSRLLNGLWPDFDGQPQPYRVHQRTKIISSLKRRLDKLPSAGENPDEDSKDVVGLQLLFLPPEPLVDLIFVHGLWGHYKKSWSRSVAPSSFWPKEWLSRDPDFKHVRISSYAYNMSGYEYGNKTSIASDQGKRLFDRLQDSDYLEGATTVCPLPK